jgi:N-acetyl-anhydromuramoyl-L-alanine amidase
MFKLDSYTGLLFPAHYLPSPNKEQRPEDEISLLVIHNISLPAGEFGNPCIEALFTNQLSAIVPTLTLTEPSRQALMELSGLHVSAHFVIDRQGKVTQYVPTTEKAWHAGISEFQGRPHCNDFSIGIELEGADVVPYTDIQYQTLVALTQELIKHYPLITKERIVGHSDIAPGRKTDPGPAFEWGRFLDAL